MTPGRVEIVEVSPRDGLQNEPEVLGTEDKVELITRAIAAGIKRIEVTSFVDPRRVPQMADAEAVMAKLPRRSGVSYIGLVLNRRGFERAAAAGCDEVNYVVIGSDEFSRRNQSVATSEALAVYEEIGAAAREAGMRLSLTIGAAFGCPYEGEVPVARVIDIAGRVLESKPSEIALADTIGVAVPTQVTGLIEAVAACAPDIPLRCHFHNTRNTGLANAYAAVEAGVRVLDASVGGIGGCPFAPAATGNIPTEDLVYMLNRMGVQSGVDVERLIELTAWMEGRLGRQAPALLGRAGNFPPAQRRAQSTIRPN
ncbi:MAG: hydroxymethylglutaryl-CoA lyase [Alphaproteobacteria bacterium]